MKIPDFIKALLVSRKFWLALIGVVGAIVMYIQGTITADVLVQSIVALMAILIAAIAGEDMAAKWGK